MPVAPLLHTVREFIHRHQLITRGDKILTAVSGGIDSMVLLDLLDTLRQEGTLDLAVAHINHQLRGKESDEDEQFVSEAAQKRGVQCYVHRENIGALATSKKQSIQEVARDVRYAFFQHLRSSMHFDKIATAHHADDNAETLLFNVIRGAGVKGLSGIPVMRTDEAIIRPLLFATRKEIMDYARARGITHREDSSNIKTAYTRNFIRHHIIPQIEEHINPNLTATLIRTSELFTQVEQYLDQQSHNLLAELLVRRSENEVVLDMQKLLLQPLFLQEYLLLHIARQFSGKEIDSGTVRAMMKIVGGETGDSSSVTKDIVFYRNRNEGIFRKLNDLQPFTYTIEPNKSYELENIFFSSTFVATSTITNNPCIEYIDATTIGKTMLLRTWKDGDWFFPFGMTEKKKLSDFFIDEKIPLFEKEKVPILESNGQIVWICGKRLDNRCKISPTTERILKLEYHPRDHSRT